MTAGVGSADILAASTFVARLGAGKMPTLPAYPETRLRRSPESLIGPSMPMALTNLVCIERAGSRAGRRADERAFLSANDCSHARARGRCSGYSQFVPMLLPECSAMSTTSPPGLSRSDRRQREHQHQSYQKAC
jgi:hypothetical protein